MSKSVRLSEMTYSSARLVLLLVGAVAAVAADTQGLVVPRMISGVPIDTLRRFPHHTSIVTDADGTQRLCGGSIVNEQWILTSARCVDQSKRLTVHFEKLYLNDTRGSYAAVVNSDAVHIYPTYFDDIAMIKLPFRLVFSDVLRPVSINGVPVSSLQNKLVVQPGFDTVNYKSDQLTYGMFNIIPNDKCRQYYPDTGEFDEYLMLCAEGWGGNKNAPCITDQGNGLIVGWPAKSELVGIYSGGSNCGSGYPAIYTNVAKYAAWINSLIEL